MTKEMNIIIYEMLYSVRELMTAYSIDVCSYSMAIYWMNTSVDVYGGLHIPSILSQLRYYFCVLKIVIAVVHLYIVDTRHGDGSSPCLI